MKSSLLIYGVTGYTGGLISRLAAREGMVHIAAGRDTEKLAAHADPLLVPSRRFALDDAAKLARGLSDVTVVLNCAGPFGETGPPLAEACLETGTHYLDLAGEVPEFEAMLALDARARRGGSMLMPGVGFGVVPTDALSARLKRRMPSATRLRLAFEAVGGVSQGTLLTLLRDLDRPGGRRREGEMVAASTGEEVVRIDLGGGARLAVTNPWRGDLVTAFWSSVFLDIDTYTVYPAGVRYLMRSALGKRLLTRPAMLRLLGRLVRRLPAGPDERALDKGLTRIWAEVEDPAGQRLAATMKGPDAYLFTARTALWVARKVLAGRAPVGFQTPVSAYGPDLIDRLCDEIPGLEIVTDGRPAREQVRR
ncbi:MAG: saccharopine dehydrogenase NADP-binding domain-containing protein [Acidobacteriota bacterium]|nr:saccharopine dehydrogenase NADP-binding domain-containing protein [Acidobacteriota bacterium]